jgi:hypothetical protein
MYYRIKSLPFCIELSEITDRAVRIEYSNKHLRVTDDGKVSKNMIIPLGQTRLTDYGGDNLGISQPC